MACAEPDIDKIATLVTEEEQLLYSEEERKLFNKSCFVFKGKKYILKGRPIEEIFDSNDESKYALKAEMEAYKASN